jgi:mono/diheme cytochrome c family protein
MTDDAPRRRARPQLNAFWATVLAFVLIYLFLRLGVPYLSQLVTGAPVPPPVPAKLLSAYMWLATLGLAIQLAISDRRLHEFTAPVVQLLVGSPSGEPAAGGSARALRYVALAIPPLLAGWFVYQRLVPQVASAATSRQQHPTLPDAWANLENPYRSKSAEEQAQATAEGVVLYQINCRPCHGTAADGAGPMAHGFQPRPIAFTDAGTIDTIVESYPVWRIEEGGPGLPAGSTPWHSAMPPWKGELERDEIWKIIMAEYKISGKQPRIPEQLK